LDQPPVETRVPKARVGSSADQAYVAGGKELCWTSHLDRVIEWASKCMFDRFTAWAHTMSDMRQGNAQVGGAEPVNAGGA